MGKDSTYEFQLSNLSTKQNILRQRLEKFQKLKEDVLADNQRLVKSAIELKEVMNQQEDTIASVRNSRGRKGDINRISNFERDLNNVKRLVGPLVDSIIKKSQ
jgi:hypothetical protein